MDHQRIEEFLVHLSEKFASGDVDSILDCLVLPTAVYFGHDMILLKDRKDVEVLTESYMSGMEAQGMAKSVLRVKEYTVSPSGRITAVAVAPMVDAEGVPQAISQTTYFLREIDGALKVEQTEHAQVPIEEDLIHAPLSHLTV